MRVIIQRVRSSRVMVDGQIIGQIGRGLNLLTGIATTDTLTELEWMARKCLDLRLFPDENAAAQSRSLWSQSVQDIRGSLLVISQFTLYGDCCKGRRPSFAQAAPPPQAIELYDQFVNILRQSGLMIETGQFGATMQVEIENDGPVTLILEREA